MPKSVITINDFVGGLNNEGSARDIGDNELTVCQNLDPSSKGILKSTRNFADNDWQSSGDTGYADVGVAPSVVGTGLFIFSNDNKVSDASANTTGMEFIVKTGGSKEIDYIEYDGGSTQPAAATDMLTVSSNPVPNNPQFYSAEGDLYIGGDHTEEPIHFQYHNHDIIIAGAATNLSGWVANSGEYPAPSGSQMNITETNDKDAATYNGSNAITGLGANEFNWIIHYGADESGLWNNTNNDVTKCIEWAGSLLYKNDAESPLLELASGASMTGKGTHANATIEITIWSNDTLTNKEYYGARLYARSPGNDTFYLAAEAQFDKGIKGSLETSWNGFVADGANWGKADTTNGYQASTGVIIAEPELLSYETLNGYDPADIQTANGTKVSPVFWKYAVVANSMAYVGNVKIGNEVYGDKILKSAIVGAPEAKSVYDIFPKSRFIDVASNDGDEITALAAYGGSLLEFKRKKLFIIDITKEYEAIDDVRNNAGVEGPWAITKTPFGIVWANRHGCYMYDGSEVTQLTMGKISDETWETNIGGSVAHTIVGYDPQERQVIVLWDGSSGGTNRGKAYVFTLDTGSWHYVSDMIPDQDQICTNMMNTRNGKLIIAGGTDVAEILEYSNRAADSAVEMQTKELVLSNPGNRKTLTDVIVRYKYGSNDLTVSIIHPDADDVGNTTVALTDAQASDGEAHLDDTSGNIETKRFNVTGTAGFQNKYWFKVKLSGNIHKDFELDEILLYYRDLGVR